MLLYGQLNASVQVPLLKPLLMRGMLCHTFFKNC